MKGAKLLEEENWKVVVIAINEDISENEILSNGYPIAVFDDKETAFEWAENKGHKRFDSQNFYTVDGKGMGRTIKTLNVERTATYKGEMK